MNAGDAGPVRSVSSQSSQVPFREAVAAWTRVALLSFGGPAGQIAVIHRIVVEEKQWVDERRFLHALGYCMLLPGPEAQQLATYLGWVLHGRGGAFLAGTLFIAPGVIAVFALSILYVSLGETRVVAGLFLGLKPAVLALVLAALIRVGRRALRGAFSAAIAAAAFVSLFALAIPFPFVVAGAAILGVAAGPAQDAHSFAAEPTEATAAPSVRRLFGTLALGTVAWLGPVALVVLAFGRAHVLAVEAVFFSKVAVVTFGGAYAVLAYVAQQAVEVYGWLTPEEMLDGLGLAETTPGPLIMVLQFVGFLGGYRAPGNLDPWLAATLGSAVTSWVTFAPSFVFIFAGAPWVEYFAGNRSLNAALTAIMAAVVGVILHLAVWFGIHSLFGVVSAAEIGPLRLLKPAPESIDWFAVSIAAVGFMLLTRFRAPMLPLLAGAGMAGIVKTLVS